MLAALGFLLRKRWPVVGLVSLAASSILLYVLSTPFIASALLDGLQWYPALSKEEVAEPSAEAIVVLSAGRRRNSPEYGGETVDSLTLERIRYAALLERRTGLPLLVSGGKRRFDLGPLSVLLADTLQNEFGVEVKFLESRSQNTAENARYSADTNLRR